MPIGKQTLKLVKMDFNWIYKLKNLYQLRPTVEPDNTF